MREINTFKELCKLGNFKVPEYQRAYSWEKEQLELLWNDVVRNTNSQYYLGHFIVEKTNDKYEIVDGQQRLTTIKIFLIAYGAVYKEHKNKIGLDLAIETVEYDQECFKELQRRKPPQKDKKTVSTQQTSSAKRMVYAFDFFHKKLSDFIKANAKDNSEYKTIDHLLGRIKESAVSVGIYEDKAVASQIFELNNTRGVNLTQMEKVKALLMQYVYLYSENKDEIIIKIQNNFAKIYELEESIDKHWIRGGMKLDDILFYHLRAIDDDKKKEERESYAIPSGIESSFQYVKDKLEKYISKGKKDESCQYAQDLSTALKKTATIIYKTIPYVDKNLPLVGDVLFLDKTHSLPILLSYFHSYSNQELQNPTPTLLELKTLDKYLKHLESFLLFWDWHDKFYNRNKKKRESFYKIYYLARKSNATLYKQLSAFYTETGIDIEKFNEWGYGEGGLSEVIETYFNEDSYILNNAYSNSWFHHRYKYILYKYELHKSTDKVKVRKELRNMIKKDNLSLDHIVARNISWESLVGKDSCTNKEYKEWEIFWGSINSIGNLTLLDSQTNSQLRDKPPENRIEAYNKHGLVNTANFAKNFKSKSFLADRWKVHVDKRSKDIKEFIFEQLLIPNDKW